MRREGPQRRLSRFRRVSGQLGIWFSSTSQTSVAYPGTILGDFICPSEASHSLLTVAAWFVASAWSEGVMLKIR